MGCSASVEAASSCDEPISHKGQDGVVIIKPRELVAKRKQMLLQQQSVAESVGERSMTYMRPPTAPAPRPPTVNSRRATSPAKSFARGKGKKGAATDVYGHAVLDQLVRDGFLLPPSVAFNPARLHAMSSKSTAECGVSLAFLQAFSALVQKHFSRSRDPAITTERVARGLLAPATRDYQCRFSDLLPSAHVGAPKYFISHSWSSPYADTAQLVSEYVMTEGMHSRQSETVSRNTKVWMDIFSVSQHAACNAHDLSDLRKPINVADATLFCLDPLGHALTRLWCLYEIWQTVRANVGARLSVLCSDLDRDSIKEMIQTMDLSRAQCTDLQDRQYLLAEMQSQLDATTNATAIIKDAIGASAAREAATMLQRMQALTSNSYDYLAISPSSNYRPPTSFRPPTSALPGGYHPLMNPNPGIPRLMPPPTASGRPMVPPSRGLLAPPGMGYEASLPGQAMNGVLPPLPPAFLEHMKAAASLTLDKCGCLLQATGQLAEALPLLQQACQVTQDLLGPRHPDTARCLTSLASLIASQGMLTQAEPLFRQALLIAQDAFGLDHAATALCMHNLADLLTEQGRLAEAETMYRQAMLVRRKLLHMEHPDLGRTLHALALLLARQGQAEEGEPLLRQAVRTYKISLGEEHPRHAAGLEDLASMLHSQLRFAEAEVLYQQAVTLRRKLHGNEHPATVRALNAFALLLQDEGKLEDAEALFRQVILLRQQVLDPDHPDIASSVIHLAILLQARGQYSGAELLYKNAIMIQQKAFGVGHEVTARTVGSLLQLMRDTGRSVEAAELLREYENCQRAVSVRRAISSKPYVQIEEIPDNQSSPHGSHSGKGPGTPLSLPSPVSIRAASNLTINTSGNSNNQLVVRAPTPAASTPSTTTPPAAATPPGMTPAAMTPQAVRKPSGAAWVVM